MYTTAHPSTDADVTVTRPGGHGGGTYYMVSATDDGHTLSNFDLFLSSAQLVQLLTAGYDALDADLRLEMEVALDRRTAEREAATINFNAVGPGGLGYSEAHS